MRAERVERRADTPGTRQQRKRRRRRLGGAVGVREAILAARPTDMLARSCPSERE
jgi:hypothetical protein